MRVQQSLQPLKSNSSFLLNQNSIQRAVLLLSDGIRSAEILRPSQCKIMQARQFPIRQTVVKSYFVKSQQNRHFYLDKTSILHFSEDSSVVSNLKEIQAMSHSFTLKGLHLHAISGSQISMYKVEA